MLIVDVRAFRANLTEYAERAKAGEMIVVRRRGRRIAVLRAATPEEELREIGLFEIRQHMGHTLRAAERGTKWLVTCHGRGQQLVLTAVPESLANPPIEWEALA